MIQTTPISPMCNHIVFNLKNNEISEKFMLLIKVINELVWKY